MTTDLDHLSRIALEKIVKDAEGKNEEFEALLDDVYERLDNAIGAMVLGHNAKAIGRHTQDLMKIKSDIQSKSATISRGKL